MRDNATTDKKTNPQKNKKNIKTGKNICTNFDCLTANVNVAVQMQLTEQTHASKSHGRNAAKTL